MQPLLSSGALEALARGNLLVAFDFDGTLAPIVDSPGEAAMRSETRRLLAAVAQRYPCAVISGRAEADIIRALGGVTVWYVVGQRGLHPALPGWAAALKGRLPEGASLEDKGASLAVHYRSATAPAQARQRILDAAAQLAGARILPGKEVVNILPEAAPDKGAHLLRLSAQAGCDTALYVGDDQSDEDVFALPPPVAGVRIEPSPDSRARWYLRDQEEMDELLARLAELRPQQGRAPERSGRRGPSGREPLA